MATSDSDSLRRRLLRHLGGPGYQPATKTALAQALDVGPDERARFRGLLRELEDEGLIRHGRKGRYTVAATGRRELTGEIRFHPRGHAFVSLDADGDRAAPGVDRVFVHPRNTSTALDGDRVAIVPRKPPPGDRGRDDPADSTDARGPEGVVTRVVERRNAPIVGTFRRRGKFAHVQPDDAWLPPTITLDRDASAPAPSPAPTNGDKVVLRVTDWPSRTTAPRGRITEVLGPADAPGVDVLSIIRRHRLRHEFPQAALDEARATPDTVGEAERVGREDWRDRPVMTIDPADARDFDDAIAVTPLDGGDWELAVHIADVAHYVTPGSALDREAERRGNSVYLVDRVIPMLPPELSNGICSLRPDVERLTRAVILRIDAAGKVRDTRFARAVIRSRRRLSYEEAIAKLRLPAAAAAADPVAQQLQIAWTFAAILRRRRFARGALDLDMPEVKVVLDADGRPRELARIDYDESHQLIEEFMLAANEAVAKATKFARIPTLYRAHDDPDDAKLDELREYVHSHGIAAGDLRQRSEIQRVLDSIRGHPQEHAIKIALLKSLKRAAYSADPLGHYGLAMANYTHFTSPIRRYADLVVHRALDALAGDARGPRPDARRMSALADHLSTTERAAAEAEQQSQKLKLLEYFERLSRNSIDATTTFDATVYEVRRLGLFVELTDFFTRGLVRADDLPHRRDGYWFDFQHRRFSARNPATTYQAGSRLRVRVERVDLARQLIDFRIDEPPTQPRARAKRRKR